MTWEIITLKAAEIDLASNGTYVVKDADNELESVVFYLPSVATAGDRIQLSRSGETDIAIKFARRDGQKIIGSAVACAQIDCSKLSMTELAFASLLVFAIHSVCRIDTLSFVYDGTTWIMHRSIGSFLYDLDMTDEDTLYNLEHFSHNK